jgi:hypothetical protein
MLRRSVQAVRLLRRIADRVFWDTCVDYFDPHEAAGPVHVACARQIAGIVDGICVPTEGIADSARRFNANVFVMPDPIDLDHFATSKRAVDFDRPVFGWSGVACKARPLDTHAAFLDGRAYLIAEQPPDLSFRYRFERWRHASFPQALLNSDVAFLPRGMASSYERNNSSFKALVFAALGIPIIANALPSYRAMAQHFDAVAFLEDFGGDPAAALAWLRTRDRDAARVRAAYDRTVWARHLAGWVAA